MADASQGALNMSNAILIGHCCTAGMLCKAIDIHASKLVYNYRRFCIRLAGAAAASTESKKQLERYFTVAETAEFRQLQASAGILISGSTAVQFFQQESYPDSDLNLYVEHDHHVEFIRWLLEIGYGYVTSASITQKRVRTQYGGPV